jgi:hypothetical protein
MARCPRNRGETGQATGGLHPDAVLADCRVALWPFHGEIVVDSGLPSRIVRGLEMPKRKSRLRKPGRWRPGGIQKDALPAQECCGLKKEGVEKHSTGSINACGWELPRGESHGRAIVLGSGQGYVIDRPES